MMQAYGTIANNGTRVPLYSITDIKDASGDELALPDRPQPALAVQPQIAFLIQNILSDNEARTPAFGANSPLNVNGYAGSGRRQDRHEQRQPRPVDDGLQQQRRRRRVDRAGR